MDGKGELVFTIVNDKLKKAEHVAPSGMRRRLGGAPIGCDVVEAARYLLDRGEEKKCGTRLIDTSGEQIPWPRQVFAN